MPEAIKPLVYVSYAWRNRPPVGQDAQTSKADDSETIVNELCQVLSREDQVEVGRDRRRVRTGDAIVDFAREIASGGLILAVISHKSLRSDGCMVHELLQAFRRCDFDLKEFGTDVLALVLEDALNDIRDPRDLVRHWLARLEQERELMELADPGRTGSPESWKTVDQLAELRGRLPDLIRALRICAMPRGAEAIREQGFHAIRKLVRQRLTEKNPLSNSQNPTLEDSKVPERRHLFVSYSHADRAWVDRLNRIMAPLLRSGGQELRLWDDSRIVPGMRWREEMETALAAAKVALLLVSAEYLASEFGLNQAFLGLLAAAQAEGMVVLWVCLRPCVVMRTPIGAYQALLPPAPSLAEMSEIQLDSAWRTIAERLWEALREPALEGERVRRDSQRSPEPLVGDDEPTASEHILRWRVRCRIWREPLSNDVDLPMVRVPSDTASKVGEFLLGVEPVSLGQWREVVGGSLLETTLTLATPAQGDLDQPVTGISQEQALEFCRLLAVHSGRYYELPSEEQWDHACRAGSVSAYSWGDAWSGHLARTTANPWGLRRMHGSVWQWCRGGALRGGSSQEPVGLRVCCLPFGTPCFQLEASKSQWRPRITRAACARVLARPLSEAEFMQLEQALQRFHILGLLRLRLFLSLLADRLAGGADDPQHPLSLEMVPDGLRRLASPAATDVFALAALAWRERAWRRLADTAKPPQELLADLGLAGKERQQAVLRAVDRAAAAFPEPR